MSVNDDFYLSQKDEKRSCLLALRSIILQREELSETKKYGTPCFTYKNKAVCYLWIEKKSNEPYILFVEGGQMDLPYLERGDRKRMKIFIIPALEDIPIDEVNEALDMAIDIAKKKYKTIN